MRQKSEVNEREMEIFRFRLTVYNSAYDTYKHSILKSKNVWQMYGDFDGYKYIVCKTEQGVQCCKPHGYCIIILSLVRHVGEKLNI